MKLSPTEGWPGEHIPTLGWSGRHRALAHAGGGNSYLRRQCTRPRSSGVARKGCPRLRTLSRPSRTARHESPARLVNLLTFRRRLRLQPFDRVEDPAPYIAGFKVTGI